MAYEFPLPEVLKVPKKKLISFYKKKGFTVSENASINLDEGYQFTLICKKGHEKLAIEVKENCILEQYFKNKIHEIQANRLPVKLYIAVPESLQDDISLSQIDVLEKKLIGLVIIKDSGTLEKLGTVSIVRQFTIEPGSTLGKYKSSVQKIQEDYNKGNCINAVRDLCELVEEATYLLATKASKKNKLKISSKDIEKKDWEYIINILGSKDHKDNGKARILAPDVTNNLKSFKDVRNLSSHWKKREQHKDLDTKLPQSMLQGVYLLRTLVKLTNSIK